MNKFLEIAKSWIIGFNPTEEQQKKADQRIAICNECPFMKHNDVGNFYYCGSCGCPIAKKIFTNATPSCPKNKWDTIDIKYDTNIATKNTKIHYLVVRPQNEQIAAAKDCVAM